MFSCEQHNAAAISLCQTDVKELQKRSTVHGRRSTARGGKADHGAFGCVAGIVLKFDLISTKCCDEVFRRSGKTPTISAANPRAHSRIVLSSHGPIYGPALPPSGPRRSFDSYSGR